MRRTLLFIPGNNANMILNGGLLGADNIIFDLEDAVSPDEKDAARELLKNALGALNFGKCAMIIRINGLDTPYWKEDLAAVLPMHPDMIMLPKTGSGDDIRTLSAEMSRIEAANGMPEGGVKIIALVETAIGVENAYAVCTASERMTGIFLGAEDLSADLRCSRTKSGEEIFYARSRIVNAARAAGIDAFDTPYTDLEDLAGLEADALFAKGMGFTGKASISPGHIAVINKVFSPSEKEIAYARDVFAAIAEAKRQGKGAVSLRGKMIDAPIVLRARTVLEMASEIEGVDYLA